MRLLKAAASTAAITFAMSQIAVGAVDKSSKWDFNQGDAEKLPGKKTDWYLGNDPLQEGDAQQVYPIGKNGKVYRSALLEIRKRAAQEDNEEVYRAAGTILDKIDGKTVTLKMKGPGMRQLAWSRFTLLKALDPDDEGTEEDPDYDSDSRVITGIASTPNADRMGDVVEPEGAQYELPIPYLWQHDSSQPIGNVTAAKIGKTGINVTVQLAKTDIAGTLKNRLDEAWQSIKLGLVRGQSIGFAPVEFSYLSDSGGYHFLKWAWLELSAVTIPANADASISTIKSFDMAMLQKSSRGQAVQRKYGLKIGGGAGAVRLSNPNEIVRPTVAERKKYGQSFCDTNAESVDELLEARAKALE
jgi:HK97 family phage prohead protease